MCPREDAVVPIQQPVNEESSGPPPEGRQQRQKENETLRRLIDEFKDQQKVQTLTLESLGDLIESQATQLTEQNAALATQAKQLRLLKGRIKKRPTRGQVAAMIAGAVGGILMTVVMTAWTISRAAVGDRIDAIRDDVRSVRSAVADTKTTGQVEIRELKQVVTTKKRSEILDTPVRLDGGMENE